MSKITNDGLTRSDTRCFTAVPIWQQWAPKGYDVTCRGLTFNDEERAGHDGGDDASGHTLIHAVVFFAEVEHRQVAAAVHCLPCRRERSVGLNTSSDHTHRQFDTAIHDVVRR